MDQRYEERIRYLRGALLEIAAGHMGMTTIATVARQAVI